MPRHTITPVILVVLGFALSRSLLLTFPEGRRSTATEIFAAYGFESMAASTRNISVYDLHASSARKADRPWWTQGTPDGVIEYPPLAISWMALPVRLFGWRANDAGEATSTQRRQYATAMRVQLAIVDAFCVCLLVYVLSRSLRASANRVVGGLASYVFGGAILFVLIYDRMDLVVGALLMSAFATLVGTAPIVFSFFLLALAINFKIVALLVAPVWVVGSLDCEVFRRSRRDQMIAVAKRFALLALAGCALFVPYMVRDGWQSVAFLGYHQDRGIQIESLIANVLFLLRPFGFHTAVGWQYGSAHLVTTHSSWLVLAVTIAMIAAQAVAILRMWREAGTASAECPPAWRVARAMPTLLAKYCVLALLIGLCGAKVFSAQYMLWLLPLAPLVLLRDSGADATWQRLLVATYVATTLIFPGFYSEVRPITHASVSTVSFLPPTPFGLALLTTRSTLLLWLTVSLWRQRPQLAHASFVVG